MILADFLLPRVLAVVFEVVIVAALALGVVVLVLFRSSQVHLTPQFGWALLADHVDEVSALHVPALNGVGSLLIALLA